MEKSRGGYEGLRDLRGDYEGLRDLSGIKLGPVRSGLFMGGVN